MRITVEQAEQKFSEVADHLQKELASIRAGRANPKLVEDIEAIVYSQKMQIKQLANITVADPTLLIIQPWDKNTLAEIKKAIEQAEIGINPINDGEMLKLPIPSLTEERRLEYVKIMKQKVEEARITVRQIRKDVLVGLDTMKKEKTITEDDYEAKEKQLQKEVDKWNEKLEKIAEDKEAELLTV
jgi:ribosome recycling factor